MYNCRRQESRTAASCIQTRAPLRQLTFANGVSGVDGEDVTEFCQRVDTDRRYTVTDKVRTSAQVESSDVGHVVTDKAADRSETASETG